MELRRVERVTHSHPALEVTRQLVEYLLRSGRVKVGDKLPSERELCEVFGVGRSAVRESLKSLSLLGLLEIRQGDGTYLRGSSSSLLPDVLEWGLLLDDQGTQALMEARRTIEVALARLAAERRTDEDLEAMRTELAGLESSFEDEARWAAHDVAFHLAIAEAAHSRTLAGLLYQLRNLLDAAIRRNQTARASDNVVKYSEHEDIFKAILARDGDLADAAMRLHMNKVATRLLAQDGGSSHTTADRSQGDTAAI
ncbi:FadR/GntR family transcriptional regulator [Saccharomonospora sp. NPDC046836]|uniref:FadR/GntR family transcriptional regulator n=1 Tax=Saccharomonospora sp. NPDC046836 TaxID=3156921 RepID=UPI0033F11FE5